MNNTEGIKTIDIKKVIESKNKRLAKLMPAFLLNWVRKILHEDDINEFLSVHRNDTPYEFASAVIERMGAKVTLVGIENIPKDQRLIFSSNHPLGGLDGVALISAVHDILGEVRFPVNDLLLFLPGLNEVFLPVNKHGSNPRNSIQQLNNAYESDKTILYFPAGMCSRKIKGQIIDLDWKKSIVTQAVKYQRDILPVYIDGKNSNFFYNLANIRKRIGIKANLEMFFLVDEMFKQKGKDIVIKFGKPLSWQTFDKSKTTDEWVSYVRKKTYELS